MSTNPGELEIERVLQLLGDGPWHTLLQDAVARSQNELVVALRRFVQAGEGSVETIWVDATDEKVAISDLLDGRLVYDTQDTALKMTGRKPVEVTIIARRKP